MRHPTGSFPKRRTRITIVDVAEKAGVHVSTASRALNPKTNHRISVKVVGKIERIATQLGYRPNPLASSLRTQKTETIGLIIPNLSDPLFMPIIAAAQERVAEDGYVTFVASSDYKPEKMLSIIEIMSRQYVAGLIVAGFELADPGADLCLSLGIPTVAVLRDPGHPQLSSVAMDDFEGVKSLVEHVLALGHKRVAYITAPLAASTARNRLEGFIAASKLRSGCGCVFDVIEANAYDVEEGERVMNGLLASDMPWTAILCFNDLLAVGALVALKAANVSCPGQVSIAGVNDLPFMSLLSPPLTSLQNAGRELGLEGARLLMNLIDNGEEPVTRILLPSNVAHRGSTGPAPAEIQPPSKTSTQPKRQRARKLQSAPPGA